MSARKKPGAKLSKIFFITPSKLNEADHDSAQPQVSCNMPPLILQQKFIKFAAQNRKDPNSHKLKPVRAQDQGFIWANATVGGDFKSE